MNSEDGPESDRQVHNLATLSPFANGWSPRGRLVARVDSSRETGLPVNGNSPQAFKSHLPITGLLGRNADANGKEGRVTDEAGLHSLR